VINEPRGSDVLVGALLCEPDNADSSAGVIFFNNVGYLGMCGHGTIGLVKTLEFTGRITPGEHRIDTPVGTVTATLHDDGSVSVRNVPSYRHAQNVQVDVPNYGVVTGDVAWGGNWFFLVDVDDLAFAPQMTLEKLEPLSYFAQSIRRSLVKHGITGANGAEIDHIELFSHQVTDADSQNFVLCPGSAYDRSPCGTGTSATLACLAADGVLAENTPWRQNSIIGSQFVGQFQRDVSNPTRIHPTITGHAFVTATAELIVNEDDPFAWGIAAPERVLEETT
jgi:4-hydroxyproline epimerase